MKANVELIDPEEIFKLLNRELPQDVRDHVLVAGSLAAAFHHREALAQRGVKTKDADLLIHPAGHQLTATEIGEKLLAAGWKKRLPPGMQPGTVTTPPNKLPAIRLYPPEHDRYFIELLIMPDPDVRGMEWQRVRVGEVYFSLAMFEFMALLQVGFSNTEHGVAYANPSMMALANLLSHPTSAEV